MNMLTFFAALCHNGAIFLSLKLSIYAIIDDAEIADEDLQRANV